MNDRERRIKLSTLDFTLNKALSLNNLTAARDILANSKDLLEDPKARKRVVFSLLRQHCAGEYKKEYLDFLTEFLEADQDTLIYAVLNGDVDSVESLLNSGRVLEGDELWAEFSMCRWNLDSRVRTLELLMKHDLDTGVRSEWGENLLHVFLRFFAKEGDRDLVEMAKLLLAQGRISPHERDSIGLSVLHTSIEWIGDKGLVRYFVEQKVDVNGKTESGWSPMHSAAEFGDQELVNLLVEAGADVSAENGDGRTPIHIAKEFNPKVVDCLLQAGAVDSEDLSMSRTVNVDTITEEDVELVSELMGRAGITKDEILKYTRPEAVESTEPSGLAD